MYSLSLLTGVYAFGFLFMLPQLFVNYKVGVALKQTFYVETELVRVVFNVELFSYLNS
uniref:Uncharacterized protein n=1 Tax=Anguilla anguilla TaxID=7936 RepID=A0A0E9PT24_ANGAN